MSRREQIRMSDAEMRAFIAERRVVTCATLGPRGRPHLMPLWYVPDGLAVQCWTYGASQKAQNLRRLPQATLQIEAGDTYEELRGVMLECDATLIDAHDEVEHFGRALMARYAPGDLDPAAIPDEVAASIARQAHKRVAIRFVPTRIVSWDHRKLGGTY